jgi:hypothetical protein
MPFSVLQGTEGGLLKAEEIDIKSFLLKMASTLHEANKNLEGRIEAIGKKIEVVDRRTERIEVAMGVQEKINSENDAEDRKRIKERLKEAMDKSNKPKFKSEVEQMGLIEYVFGICKPDGRVGKHGSRCGLDYSKISLLDTGVLSTELQAHSSTIEICARFATCFIPPNLLCRTGLR